MSTKKNSNMSGWFDLTFYTKFSTLVCWESIISCMFIAFIGPLVFDVFFRVFLHGQLQRFKFGHSFESVLKLACNFVHSQFNFMIVK